MARYVYEASKVSESLERLRVAKDCLSPTEAALINGFNMLENARGIENIDFGNNKAIICNFPNEAKEYVETLSKEIDSKRTEIEEYDSAPWYKKLFATIGMSFAKLGEGLIATFENIGDACVSLAGFTAGIFGNKDFQNSCAEFIKKDASRKVMSMIMSSAYKEGSYINKYSVFSEQSTMANILKGIGTATGYVLLSMAGVGITTKAFGHTVIGSTGMNTIMAGVGGLGSGTEIGLLQGMSYNEAFGQGVKRAAVSATVAYVAGKVGDKLKNERLDPSKVKAESTGTSGNQILINQSDDAINGTQKLLSSGDDIANGSQKLLGPGGKSGQLALPEPSGSNALALTDKAVGAGAKTTASGAKAVGGIANYADDGVNVATKSGNQARNVIEIMEGEGIGDQLTLYGERTSVEVIKGETSSGATATVTAGEVAAKNTTPALIKSPSGALTTTSANLSGSLVAKASPVVTNSIANTATSIASSGIGNTVSKFMSNTVSKVTTAAPNFISKAATTIATSAPKIVGTGLQAATMATTTAVTNKVETTARDLDNINISNPVVTQVNTKPIEDSAPVNKTTNINANKETVYKPAQSTVVTTPQQTQKQTTEEPTVTSAPKHNTSTYTIPKSFDTENNKSNNDNKNNNDLATSIAQTIGQKTKPVEIPDDTIANTKLEKTPATQNTTPAGIKNDNSNSSSYQLPIGSTTSVTGGNKYPTVKSQVEGSVAKNNISTTTQGSSGSTHAGGGYSGGGYSFSGSSAVTSNGTIGAQDTKGTLASSITKTKSDKETTSRIAVAEDIEEDAETAANNYVVPTSAALSAAAAAGIAAKITMDKKQKEKEEERQQREEDEDYKFETETGFKDIDELNDEFTLLESY